MPRCIRFLIARVVSLAFGVVPLFAVTASEAPAWRERHDPTVGAATENLCCISDDPHAGAGGQSPDYSWMDQVLESNEPTGTGTITPTAAGPIAPAAGQPAGALSGRVVFMSGGHGWTAGASSWFLQRPVLLEMNEDYGNVDQMNFLAAYCFNAGATVVPFRPIGSQTNEVVLDNDDAGVTYAGTWSNSGATLFYGSPGDVPYRFASLAATETATATYAPNLPAAGLYPVYTWVAHGANRTVQLYRIRHTGGESQVRVPHHMVGNGWVYLGTYHFNAGSNANSGTVIISNLQPTPSVGSVVIADAIRFGNGMGTFDRGFGKSTYPSEEECSRYWVQRGLGQGQSPTLYDPDYPSASTDDQDDNVGTPPRMAREMNYTGVIASIYKRVLISFHSNAGGSRGVVGLWNDNANFPGTGTPNQYRLAQLCGLEVNGDLVGISSPPLEVPWYNRGSSITATQTFAFGEIHNGSLGGEMDATIVEVAFHDDEDDALLLRAPKARNWIGRATYQAVVRYMNEFDGAPLTFLPEPPQNPRAIASGSNIVVSWSAPVDLGGSGTVTGYLLYQSTNGYGFGNPVGVSSASTSLTFSNLAANTDYFFRVAATNAGGESFPTETVACRFNSTATAKVLLVSAFDRFDRTLNLRQTPNPEAFKSPGHDANSGTMDRMLPGRNNAFDYLVPHATAVSASGFPFDSCQSEAVSAGLVTLTNYAVVIWACGNESTADESFSSAEQTKVIAFLAAGGNLFASGSEIAWDLDRPSGPTAADRNFMHSQLHATYASDDAGVYTFTAAGGGIFGGNTSGVFDDGSKGIYAVGYPDVLTATGSGAVAGINYSGGTNAAAIVYDGSAGGGKTVYFGFPFETITSASVRDAYMADILTFFVPNTPPAILVQPQSQAVKAGSNVTFSVNATGTLPLTYQWRFNGTNLAGVIGASYTRTNVQPDNAGNYSVAITNLAGNLTSSNALLTVTLPVPLKFELISLLPDQRIRVVLSAEPGVYALQTSSNLSSWTTLTNLTNTGSMFEFTDDAITNRAIRFYRATQ